MDNRNTPTEELRSRLRRQLVECGIDPDIEDGRQLATEGRLIDACRKRKEEIDRAELELRKLRPTKAAIADEAGIARTSLSDSHNCKLNSIYYAFFPPEDKDTVSAEEYRRVKDERDELQRKVDGHGVTQVKYMEALDDKRKLEAKVKLQEEAITNLHKLLERARQMYYEATGDILNINAAQVYVKHEDEEVRTAGRVVRPNWKKEG